MLRRTHIPRAALSINRAPAARAFTKPSLPLSASSQLTKKDSNNVLFEFDAHKVGNEIRKRGLANLLGVQREGGMDRVRSVC